MSKSKLINKNLVSLNSQNDQPRKAQFLKILLRGQIGISITTMILLLFLQSDIGNYTIVIVFLFLAVGLAYLNAHGYTHLSSHLFCHEFTYVFFSLFWQTLGCLILTSHLL